MMTGWMRCAEMRVGKGWKLYVLLCLRGRRAGAEGRGGGLTQRLAGLLLNNNTAAVGR